MAWRFDDWNSFERSEGVFSLQKPSNKVPQEAISAKKGVESCPLRASKDPLDAFQPSSYLPPPLGMSVDTRSRNTFIPACVTAAESPAAKRLMRLTPAPPSTAS